MKKIVISLFDRTGNMIKPWLEHGYECWIVDIRHPVSYETGGITKNDSLYKVHYDLMNFWPCNFQKENIAIVFAFPPCDHLAVSGSRWFKGKGLRKLAYNLNLFATAVEFCEWSGAPYMIENPVSTIATYWRKPDFYFEPYYFSNYNSEDNYHKKTCLWIGNDFILPKTKKQKKQTIDNRIHTCAPSNNRKDIRSTTPLGFARAVFENNVKRYPRMIRRYSR